MQIRLTVAQGPRGGGQAPAEAQAPSCEVLVTAPAGTVLAAVTGSLASAAAAACAGEGGDGGGPEQVAVYAGTERLDPHRQVLGEPPLLDGAVVSLHGPSAAAGVPAHGPARARLHVTSGPDAGGIHLLQGGAVRLGRSSEADVPLDDPDVSRIHCAVTVTGSGAVTVTDLGSTNGTWLDGVPVGGQPVHFRPGSTLALGESAVRLESAPDTAALPTVTVLPDGNGRLRLAPARGPAPAPGRTAPAAPAGAVVPREDGTHGAGFVTPGPPPAGEEQGRRRGRGFGGWSRLFAPARTAPEEAPPAPRPAPAPADPRAARLPDPAGVLLTALGPGPALWEREPDHPDALTVRLGTAHGGGDRPGHPVTADLRESGSLGLAGPRERLTGFARSVLAQLTAMHGPSTLEVVLLSADPSRPAGERAAEWDWLTRLPHLRPGHGQDCRLLTAFDGDQATARTAELLRRLTQERGVPGGRQGPFTLLVVDGDPGAPLRRTVARLAGEGPAAGIHLLCLADAPAATPASPLAETVRAAGARSPAFGGCGVQAVLSGAVATAVRVVRHGPEDGAEAALSSAAVATVDAVSAAWAERFARALAPLREPEGTAARTGTEARPVVTLPRTARLLDELGLARATPAALLARWSEPEPSEPPRACLVFGAGPRGPVEAGLGAEHRHALVSGASGTGKTELLRALAVSLASAERPDRLRLLLVDGDGDPAREGLSPCLELPHADARLTAADPVEMREFAQELTSELKRRTELLGGASFDEYVRSAHRPPRVGPPRTSPEDGAADLDSEGTRGTLRLRPGGPHRTAAAQPEGGADPLPRLVVLVDDLDTLVEPALGNPGRPAAGSVVRALESVAREGARLGVHLIAASGPTEQHRSEAVAHIRAAELQARLTAEPAEGEGEEPLPGRGVLTDAAGGHTPFQAGRVTGRIPRTSTLRPTVIRLEAARAGDPPARRPVRELGNGPTDLALLASATVRAARSLGPAGPGARGPSARSHAGREGALDT